MTTVYCGGQFYLVEETRVHEENNRHTTIKNLPQWNLLKLLSVMVDYHTMEKNITQDDVEDDN